MGAEMKTTPLRTIDMEQVRKDVAANEAKSATLTHDGQKLLARIRPCSRYYGQGERGALFPVCVGPGHEYVVLGGPGGQYRLDDVDLFAIFDSSKPPTQITQKNRAHPLRTWKDDNNAWWHCRSLWGVGGTGLSEAEAVKNWATRNPKEVKRLGLDGITEKGQP